MKQKDFLIIGAVILASVIISVIVSNKFFAVTTNRQQTIQTVQPISSSFNNPSSVYFNNKSIDPSQLIPIGIESNPSPFENSTTQ